MESYYWILPGVVVGWTLYAMWTKQQLAGHQNDSVAAATTVLRPVPYLESLAARRNPAEYADMEARNLHALGAQHPSTGDEATHRGMMTEAHYQKLPANHSNIIQ